MADHGPGTYGRSDSVKTSKISIIGRSNKKEEKDPKEQKQSAQSESAGQSSGSENVDYENALQQTGHGSFSYFATGTCCLIFIHSLLEMVAIAYVITPAECELKLTVSQLSWINSAVFIGIMITAIFWGVMGDKFGRRRIMLPAIVATVFASFASSMCTQFLMMFLFRLLTGFMVSASSAMVLVYLAELQDNAHRDTAISFAITSAQMSFAILPALAWVIVPQTFSLKMGPLTVTSWRVFMWLWGVVGLAGAICLLFLPESPAYTMASKGPAAAHPILAKMYAKNFKTEASRFPVRSIAAATAELEGSLISNLAQMMKAPMRKCVLLSHYCMFIVFLLANGLYIWLPDFLNAAVAKPWRSINMCTLIHEKYSTEKQDQYFPFFYTAIVVPNEDVDCSKGVVNWIIYPMSIGTELFYLIPFVTVVVIINKVSQTKLYGAIMWMAALGLLLSLIPQCMVAIGFLVIGLACGSCCCILTALAVDAFPTSLRGLATCTMYMSGQLGAVVGTSLVELMSSWLCYIIVPVLAAMSAGSSFALIFLWPNIREVRKVMESKNYTY